MWLLYRLLFNLTENAIKYNRTGGSVEVSVEREGGQAAIRVRDTGPGIAEEYRDSIFQPFFRVDKSRSRAMGGRGTGTGARAGDCPPAWRHSAR